MKAWLLYLLIAPTRLLLKLPALFVVPFLDDLSRRLHPIWGAEDAKDLSYWNIAVRNGVHNFTNRATVPYHSYGDEDMESAGFKKRYRHSKDGNYASLRITWGDKRLQGKKEFYIGWTMDSKVPKMRLTLQPRLF